MRKRRSVMVCGISLALLLLGPLGARDSRAADPATPAPGAASDLQQRVAASFVRIARQQLRDGQVSEAIANFEAALRYDPSMEAARAGLADAQAMTQAAGQKPAAVVPPTAPTAAVAATPEPPAPAAAPAPAKPSETEVAVALATLKGLNDSARRSTERGDFERAAEEFELVLLTAQPVAPHADVMAIVAEAKAGLTLARERVQQEAKAKADAAAQARAEEAAKAATPAAAPAGKGADDSAIEAERQAKIQESRRQVTEMLVPQTKILVRPNLPEKMSDVFARRIDHTATTIGGPPLGTGQDEELAQLIEARLLRRVTIEFKDTPFGDVVKYIQAAAGVNIVVDPAVAPAAEPVRNFTVADMELRNVLKWLLRFQKLDYRIRDGAIYISNTANLADKPLIVSHDIADLTVKVKGFNSSQSLNEISPEYDKYKSWLTAQGGRPEQEQEKLEQTKQGEEWARFIRENVAPGTWGEGEGALKQNVISYRNGKLVVTHVPEVQDQIRDLLASFRKARAIQVAIQARFIDINEDFLEDLDFNWSGLPPATAVSPAGPYGIVGTRGRQVINVGSTPSTEVSLGQTPGAFAQTTGLNVNVGFLRAWQVNLVLTAVRKQKQGTVLTAPRVTCYNTQEAFLIVNTRRNFVRTYDTDGNPEIGQVNDGIVFDVQPTVSADRRYITLVLKPSVNKVQELQEFAFRARGQVLDADGTPIIQESDEDVIQLPVVQTRQVQTTVSVPDGGTLMIGGLAQADESQGYATVPVLGDIPIIKWFFTSRRKVDSRTNLIVLVTADILQQQEE